MSMILGKFRIRCQEIPKPNNLHDYRGRATVFGYLISRFGIERVQRHKRHITQALENVEGVCAIP